MILPRGLGDGGDDATPLELPRRRAGAQKLPGQVDGDDRVPLLERHLVERGIPLQSGIADRDVQRAEFRDGGGIHPLDLVLAAHIGLQRDGAAPHGLDLMRHLVGRLGVRHVVHHDICARPGQAERHRLPDAGVGAGDDSRLSRQHRMIGCVRQAARIRQSRGGRVFGIGGAHPGVRSVTVACSRYLVRRAPPAPAPSPSAVQQPITIA